jgi:hypothetical protein
MPRFYLKSKIVQGGILDSLDRYFPVLKLAHCPMDCCDLQHICRICPLSFHCETPLEIPLTAGTMGSDKQQANFHENRNHRP